MRRQLKIFILIVMCLIVVGLYFGKNIYFKSINPNEKNRIESSKESKNTKNESLNKPTLLEFSTTT